MLNDMRTAWRQFRSTPVFTVSAAAIIALAVGLNAAIFGVADAVLFRPLPYADPDGVFVIRMADARTSALLPDKPVPFEYVQLIAAHHRGVSGTGMRSTQSELPHLASDAEWASTVSVTTSYMRVLGVAPIRGRLFNPADTGDSTPSALLTYGFWQRRFAGRDDALGRTMRVGSDSVSIVGVLPRGFVFPSAFGDTPSGGSGLPDYVTAAREPVVTGDWRSLIPIARGGVVQDPIVRLRPGVTRQQAQAEMDALVATIRPSGPAFVETKPILQDVRSVVFPTGRRVMALLVAGAALVLLVGCANLATLLLARSRRTERQIGLRMALGATPGRLLRPVLFETAAIGFSGALLGLLAASLAFRLLLRQVPPIVYGSAQVGVGSSRVVLLAIMLGLASGLLFGILPAWRATTIDVQALLLGRAQSRSRARWAFTPSLVTVQVALTIVLVFAATVAVRALAGVLSHPLGFTPEHVVSIRAGVQGMSFYRQAIDRLASRSDVVSVGAVANLPLDGTLPDTFDEEHRVSVESALPGYLETIGARHLRGRLPAWSDLRPGRRVAVATASAARALFGDADPLGRSFRLRRGGEVSLIGIVGDIRKTLDGRHLPQMFAVPDTATARLVLVARLKARRSEAVNEIRREMSVLSPDEPIVARWWSDSVDALVPFRARRFQALVLGAFAILALTLTGLGVFAVASMTSLTRAQEMGVRLALGATPGALVRLMAQRACAPVVVGVVLGVVTSAGVASFLEARLYGVDARGPGILTITAAVVVLSAGLAAYLPARSAGRVDPAQVLRAW